jgi:hypothetical protein
MGSPMGFSKWRTYGASVQMNSILEKLLNYCERPAFQADRKWGDHDHSPAMVSVSFRWALGDLDE